MSAFTLHLGDCIDVMRSLPDNSVDSIVTDPPYGIRFMGKAWDGADIEARATARRSRLSRDACAGEHGGHQSLAAEAGKYDMAPAAMLAFQEFSAEWAREAYRVLKPGGHLLSFASSRTYHRMTSGIEDAGFEVRDQMLWLYGSGFPKSHNLGGDWEGWGTALKPAHEPICMGRKPLAGTVAANVQAHGTGALNIDACRIALQIDVDAGQLRKMERAKRTPGDGWGMNGAGAESAVPVVRPEGRWPANVLHDGSDAVLAMFPAKAGASSPVRGTEPSASTKSVYGQIDRMKSGAFHGDQGSAARFFYCAKASRADRNEGCAHMVKRPLHWSSGDKNPGSFQSEGTDKSSQNHHPTVKPTDLMAYLCRLITPPGGVVLDPFMGSGSTGKACMREGFDFIGIELEQEYMDIAWARIAHAKEQAQQRATANQASPQFDLFDNVA